jgi:hypothetical protein
MIWEIRNDIDTFCAGDNGPTYPSNMDEVSGYVSGRSGVRIETKYNAVGYAEDRIRNFAAGAVKGYERWMATPAVIGIGWFSHYPLAYGYQRGKRTYCVFPGDRVFCYSSYRYRFYVNQGWGGDSQWVDGSIFFAGRAYPNTMWVDGVGLYRRSTGTWYIDYVHNANTDEVIEQWGGSNDWPVAGDLDRDGAMDDIARYAPSAGLWTLDYNRTRSVDAVVSWWPISGGLPVIGDFDRDGYADDLAVYRDVDRRWWYDYDHDGSINKTSPAWGYVGDYPVAGDFDRDGFLDDVALYRPSTMVMYYDYDHDADTDTTSGPWVSSGMPIAGDFDRDGYVDDVALFVGLTGKWYYDLDHDGTTNVTIGSWGWTGDRPFAGAFLY